jgi:hypothetical protein
MKTPSPGQLVARNAVERFVDAAPITLFATFEDVEPLADAADRRGGSGPELNEPCSVTLERGDERGLALLLDAPFGRVVRVDEPDTLRMRVVVTRRAEATEPSQCDDDDDSNPPSRSHAGMLLQALHRAGVLVG